MFCHLFKVCTKFFFITVTGHLVKTVYCSLFSNAPGLGIHRIPEAEFLDVNGTKVLKVYLLAIHNHLY
jgi:hypothetical protein